jgi:hypothetical protein
MNVCTHLLGLAISQFILFGTCARGIATETAARGTALEEKLGILFELIAFFMVAPEFIGPRRLEAIEKKVGDWLSRRRNRIAQWEMGLREVIVEFINPKRNESIIPISGWPFRESDLGKAGEVGGNVGRISLSAFALFLFPAALGLAVVGTHLATVHADHSWRGLLEAGVTPPIFAIRLVVFASFLPIGALIIYDLLRQPITASDYLFSLLVLLGASFMGWLMFQRSPIMGDEGFEWFRWGLLSFVVVMETVIASLVSIVPVAVVLVLIITHRLIHVALTSLAERHELRLWVFTIGALFFVAGKGLAWIALGR